MRQMEQQKVVKEVYVRILQEAGLGYQGLAPVVEKRVREAELMHRVPHFQGTLAAEKATRTAQKKAQAVSSVEEAFESAHAGQPHLEGSAATAPPNPASTNAAEEPASATGETESPSKKTRRGEGEGIASAGRTPSGQAAGSTKGVSQAPAQAPAQAPRKPAPPSRAPAPQAPAQKRSREPNFSENEGTTLGGARHG